MPRPKPKPKQLTSGTDIIVSSKGMPAAQDAERSILGGILLDNRCYAQAASYVMPSDFYLDAHRRIFARIIELMAAGRDVDIITLVQELQKHKEVDQVGGVAYVASLTDGLPRRPSIMEYAKIVREKSNRRAIVHAMATGAGAAMDHAETNDEIISIVMDRLLTVQSNSNKKMARKIGDAVDELIDDMEEKMYTEGDDGMGLTYGIAEVDRITTGIQPGELHILAGFTGSGKTAMAAQVLMENAIKGYPVVMFSLEMTQTQILRRCLTRMTAVPNTRMRNPRDNMHRTDLEKLKFAAKKLKEYPIYIDDSSDLSIEELSARARLYKMQYNCLLFGVDYLQLLTWSANPMANDFERISAVSRGLRLLAKDTNTGTLALSQLARPESKSRNVRPTLHLLKGSGSIEQDAHVVGFTYHPEDDKHMATGEDEFIIAKQREGVTGKIECEYDTFTLEWKDRKKGPEQSKMYEN